MVCGRVTAADRPDAAVVMVMVIMVVVITLATPVIAGVVLRTTSHLTAKAAAIPSTTCRHSSNIRAKQHCD
jgi:hypothetical protein